MTTATTIPSQAARRPFLAGAAGNVMEWYDFTVYGYFAATIGRQFFPSQDPFASLLASFVALAVGFVVRPFGALLFGHIGDTVGRRTALWISVLAMAVPTFLIGLLPSYAQIGTAAPVLLVLLRLLQGLAVAGEVGTSLAYLAEHALPGRRARTGAAGPIGIGLGVLAGSAVGAVLTTVLDQGAVQAWGWRLPFLFGLCIAAGALYARRNLPDDEPCGTVKAPLREAFAMQWRTMLTLLCLNAVGAVGFYLCFLFVTTYLRQTEHMTASHALDINTAAMLVQLLSILGAAALADRIGRKPVLVAAAAGQLVLGWPAFWLMHHPSPALALLGQCLLAVMAGAFTAPVSTVMAEMLPRRVRCTAMSFSLNVGFGVLGGLTPLVALYLIRREADDLSPAYLLMAAAAISLLTLCFIRETGGKALPGEQDAGAHP